MSLSLFASLFALLALVTAVQSVVVCCIFVAHTERIILLLVKVSLFSELFVSLKTCRLAVSHVDLQKVYVVFSVLRGSKKAS